MKKITICLMMMFVLSELAYGKKVRNIDGVKIPPGLTAKYDKLENVTVVDYKIYTMSDEMATTLSANIYYNNSNSESELFVLLSSQSIKEDSEGTSFVDVDLNADIFIDTAYKLNLFIDATYVDIFIVDKDEPEKKYTYKLVNKLVWKSDKELHKSFGRPSEKYSIMREYEYTQNKNLILFLSNNLQNKSAVTLRYSNSPTKYVEHKLSSDDTKKLYSMLSLYKELKAKKENK